MLFLRCFTFTILFCVLLPFTLSASDTQKGADIDLAHISDSHFLHLVGDLHIPLPVILLGKKGWHFFLSSAFHHDQNAQHVFQHNKERFVMYKDKIYFASPEPNLEGQYLNMKNDGSNPPILLNERPWDFSITKIVFSMFMSIAVMLILFISIAKSYKKNNNRTRGLTSFIEPIIVFVRDDIAKPNLKEHAGRFLPYLLTLFFFIWINNLIGLIPIFPFGANLTGNIAFTGTLAFLTFIITSFNAKRHYWKHVINHPSAPWWLKFPPLPLITIIEIISVFVKPITLMIRLFANITAGHVLVLSIISLAFIFQSYVVGLFSSIFLVFILLIEILVGFLQAYIFSILTSLYVGMAVNKDEH